jgi:hypothetical protein
MAMADYLKANDPYHHLIVIHNGSVERLYLPLMGKSSSYTGAALQINFYEIFDVTRYLHMASDLAGKPWVLMLDETRPGASGRAGGQPDATPPDALDPDHNEPRKGALWACLMAGCAGTDTYFGYNFPQGSDLKLDSFRPWEKWWDQMRYAHDFFVNNKIPFQEMDSHNERISSGWALAGSNVLVAYFPAGVCTAGGRGGGGGMGGAAFAPPFPGAANGRGRGGAAQPANDVCTPPGPGTVGGAGGGRGTERSPGQHGGGITLRPDQPRGITGDLSEFNAGSYDVRWYNPRTGGSLQTGTIATLTGGGKDSLSIGEPPADPRLDWVALIRPSASQKRN